jgi:PAS domain S-box-containing protein
MLNATMLLNAMLTPAVLIRLVDQQWCVLAQNQLATDKWGAFAESELTQMIEALELCWYEGKSTERRRMDYSGETQFINAVFSPVSLSDGHAILLHAVPVSADRLRLPISERDNLATRFNLVVAGSKGGIYDWNILEDQVYWSDRMKAILGASSYQFLGTAEAFWERVHPEDSVMVDDALQGHLVHCWPFDVECRVRTDAGYYVWINVTGQAVWDESGRATRLAGSVVDITDRKRAQMEIQEREKLIESILDALPLNVVVKDAHGCIRFFNEQAEKTTGTLREQAIGRTDFEIFPPQVAMKNMLDDMRLRKDGGTIILEENIQKDNTDVWLLAGKKMLTYHPAGGQVESWILGFSIDITDRKLSEIALLAAKETAENAVRAKSDFLSTMSHEIRTPLNSVIGTASLLMDSHLDAEQRVYVGLVKQSGEHLLGLINDILDFSKLEAGKMLVEREPFRVSGQLALVSTILSSQLAAKGLTLKSHISSKVPDVVYGDAHKLRQVLLNLASNAIKFTSHGDVRFDVLLDRHANTGFPMMCFSVSDTGIGIPADKIGLLFNEFSQVDASTTRKFGGTGLGLAICKKLVGIMGGDIGVTSEHGLGSRFWFTIPLEAADAALLEPQVVINSNQKEQLPLSILVAEDNPSNQLLIRAILSKLGHKVVIAKNGLEVVEMAQQARYHLILMDMQMPEMDGLEATRAIRALGGIYHDLPIIALTANALEGDKGRVLEAGMNDYLSKPIDIVKLKDALLRWSA